MESFSVDVPPAPILIYVHHAGVSENVIEKIVSNALLVILDDCVYAMMADHPLKRVYTPYFLFFSSVHSLFDGIR